jgi:SAM-dependent methyltransferase
MIDTTVHRFPRHKWPKIPPPLTREQIDIMNDWMQHWHGVLPQKYGVIEHFNHTYPLSHRPSGHIRTLELGAGLGAHAELEDLLTQEYHCVEIRENMAAEIRRRFPSITVLTEDCQGRLPYQDGFFDRIVAVHVLEHLPYLPRAITEAKRLLKLDGIFSIVIPCDPGVAYEFARKISSERIFRRRYKLPYMWLMRREHLNSPGEILSLLGNAFEEIDREYFPLRFLPISQANLCIGATFRRVEGSRR